MSKTLKLIRGIHGLKRWQQASVVTIGNFDGVHIGHQQMIARLCEESQQRGLPSVLITFEPLPHEFFAGEKAPLRLMSLRDKLGYLAEHSDLDALLCLRFDKNFSQQTAEQFVKRILVEGLDAKYVLLGDDFRFGYQRLGDFDLLKQEAEQAGFDVEAMTSVCHRDKRASSTLVRTTLAEGNLEQAAELLGRPYRLSGRVVKGDQLGRQLGYPTANIHLKRSNLALSGVFAVSVDTSLGVYQGMANIGWRPTIAGRELRFEVNIFDFSDDIYGQYLDVDFHAKLRDEQRFDSIDRLTTQLGLDEQAAREYFRAKDAVIA